MAENSTNGSKTLWEKEKLLPISNFSFSQRVFKRLVLQTRKKLGLVGEGLIHMVVGTRSTVDRSLAAVIRL